MYIFTKGCIVQKAIEIPLECIYNVFIVIIFHTEDLSQHAVLLPTFTDAGLVSTLNTYILISQINSVIFKLCQM